MLKPHAKVKITLGIIGCGGHGGKNLQRFLSSGVADVEVAALCDGSDEALAAAAKAVGGEPRRFRDFRVMLDEMAGEMDAVVVSTPDHTHAAAAIAAMKRGLHCFCEKPLGHTVAECREMARVAQEMDVVTQMGILIHATDNYRRVVELVESGAIGRVTDVHVWCGKGWGGNETRPAETVPVPEGQDWDLWLGPAPYRPYNPCYLGGNWRRWWDFGSGTLGDMACHIMDLPFWALKLEAPTEVEAEGPPLEFQTEMAPLWLKVKYLFPQETGPVNVTWYDGEQRPAILAELGLPEWNLGVLFVGEDGMLLADYNRRMLYPDAKFAGFTEPEPWIEKSLGHHAEWLHAIKTGGQTTCNFAYSGRLSEAVQLGAIAYRTGRKLVWDAEKLEIVGDPEASALLKTEYREGWEC